MANKSMNDLMVLVQRLSEKEQQNIVNKIMDMLNTSEAIGHESSNHHSCHSMVSERLGEKPNCPHCHAEAKMGYIVKRGFHKDVQRYYCKHCKRMFVATTNTAFARTRKTADVWKEFIKMTIEGYSLKDCSEKCEIAYQTAFTWRHKILNVFKVSQNNTSMAGEIQIDEMLIPISYKGNHYKRFHVFGNDYKGCESPLPRKPFKRGSDNKSPSSKQKACVFCMVENGNKGFYATVPGVGFMNNKMLEQTIRKHVRKENSLILADQYKTTANFLKENNYNHMILAANTSDNPREHKPEIRNGHHMQHVNAMHRLIRQFLGNYHGVSTKHLEGYISMYVWMRNTTTSKKKKKAKIFEISLQRASLPDCYISRKSISTMPAIPYCA